MLPKLMRSFQLSSPVAVRNVVVGSFFGLLLLLGFALHRDYGVSWDEPNNHLNGLVNIKYLVQLIWPARAQQEPGYQLIPALRQFRDADHGPAFEIPVAIAGYLFTDGDSRSFYFLRHLATFLVFTAGVWATYQLGKQRYKSWQAGLLASVLLVLSPRMFGEAFYNGKDIVYMAFFTLAMYSLVRVLARPSAARVVVHSIATALAIDVRVQGLLLVVLTLLVVAASPAGRQRYGRTIGLYIGCTLLFVLVGWPYLWATPFAELLAALPRMGRYPWPFTNFYLGAFWPATHLPWHYILVWLLITTPLLYIVAALCGIGVSCFRLLRFRTTYLTTLAGQIDVLLLLWLLGPLVTTCVLHVVVYEEWRHVYFTYPALLLLAVGGLRALWQAAYWRSRWVAIAATGGVGATLAYTAAQMVQLHPYEHMYFSFLPARTAERLFERDYWGLSYRQGLEWLMRHDPSPQLAINVVWHYPLYNNSLILPPADRARMHYVPLQQAKYFMTAYRWHPQSYRDSLGREIYTIRANGVKILSVFQRH